MNTPAVLHPVDLSKSKSQSVCLPPITFHLQCHLFISFMILGNFIVLASLVALLCLIWSNLWSSLYQIPIRLRVVSLAFLLVLFSRFFIVPVILIGLFTLIFLVLISIFRLIYLIKLFPLFHFKLVFFQICKIFIQKT